MSLFLPKQPNYGTVKESFRIEWVMVVNLFIYQQKVTVNSNHYHFENTYNCDDNTLNNKRVNEHHISVIMLLRKTLRVEIVGTGGKIFYCILADQTLSCENVTRIY